jgi:hypothetical protein
MGYEMRTAALLLWTGVALAQTSLCSRIEDFEEQKKEQSK